VPPSGAAPGSRHQVPSSPACRGPWAAGDHITDGRRHYPRGRSNHHVQEDLEQPLPEGFWGVAGVRGRNKKVVAAVARPRAGAVTQIGGGALRPLERHFSNGREACQADGDRQCQAQSRAAGCKARYWKDDLHLFENLQVNRPSVAVSMASRIAESARVRHAESRTDSTGIACSQPVSPSCAGRNYLLPSLAAIRLAPKQSNPTGEKEMASYLSITEAHVLAVLAGVLFGCAAIATACWVWLRKQIFAFGGSALCGSGVVLLGLSIWHSVEFGVSGSSISLKLQAQLEQQFKAIDAHVAALDHELQQSSAAVADVREISGHVAVLDQELRQNSYAVAAVKDLAMRAQASADMTATSVAAVKDLAERAQASADRAASQVHTAPAPVRAR
jgi:hypothetical protein